MHATLNDALLASAKEFASVANPGTGKSYYAGQGNNKASISAERMTESLLAQQKSLSWKILRSGMDLSRHGSGVLMPQQPLLKQRKLILRNP